MDHPVFATYTLYEYNGMTVSLSHGVRIDRFVINKNHFSLTIFDYRINYGVMVYSIYDTYPVPCITIRALELFSYP